MERPIKSDYIPPHIVDNDDTISNNYISELEKYVDFLEDKYLKIIHITKSDYEFLKSEKMKPEEIERLFKAPFEGLEITYKRQIDYLNERIISAESDDDSQPVCPYCGASVGVITKYINTLWVCFSCDATFELKK